MEKKPASIEKIIDRNMKSVRHAQLIATYLAAYDAIAVTVAYFVALWLRFDLQFSAIQGAYFKVWLIGAPIYAVICLLVFRYFKMYRSMWRFASYTELQRAIYANAVTIVVQVVLMAAIFYFVFPDLALKRMPLSYYFMGALFQFILTAGIRFSYRFLLLIRNKKAKEDPINALVIGAGAAATIVIRELKQKSLINEKIVGIIDDNPNKWHRDIDGIPIIGGRKMIPEAVKNLDVTKIYMAIPSLSATERKAIIDICKETGCELMTLPGMYQLMLGNVTVNSLRKVEVEDLLGRDPVKMNSRETRTFLSGKTVLVTGGGGSIGSELCRRLASFKELKKLIIFDIYENNAHAIKLELNDKYPELDLEVLIGSVRNSRRLKQVFSEYRPDIVFHAAAHKHVPLMEDSPCEAIKNNSIGTYYTAYAAMLFGCERFVLISTDKAVNPVNVMGASKRICEMVVQAFARKIAAGKAHDLPNLQGHVSYGKSAFDEMALPYKPKTEFVAVRFGNVLGSNGSVIPRFREQIAAGGPVTVTHPDIIRYFMTIPEAASLVLQAATIGGAGNIFVLDMGTPVKIDDLARNMIKLSGLKPDVDIMVEYTGLRPGEKLYEERLMDEEGMRKTENELINIGSPIEFDDDKFLRQLEDLMIAAYQERADIRDLIEEVVPTYHPAGRHGTEEKGEAYQEQIEAMEAKAEEKSESKEE